ncbi:PhoX family protein [Rhodococcus sp. BP-252]|uniref:PhoX family protein n=1 Tax=unclassified Rhodococcus (in: high G+C Gram-positive bacteria) TaxID=192944 RepID=UPI001C9AE50E|nr:MULTISPECIES: PhoX family phosphatase [unclassified Rhodococcus (in: high G+C Gram-positive bacteria)]MBY6411979.1 PhoX family protein [Rhodococcus sp. BP-320]MBY6416393.1 PhoX family protein [Rhodococcus sp. BP-321]MBY6420801.1 PhoX family protein [Rhodococcus sp. BP-324]MBY6426417.1 PhoX family protein [Rhodococcus sp. BP-323]MBY6431416.1 PhoX family protein [Rhodococcus sp. BP-322]
MKPLPLFAVHDGSSARSNMTCKYKCGDACFHEVPNTSKGQYFGDIVKTAMTRRGILRGGAMAVVAVGAGGVLAACSSDDSSTTTAASGSTTAPEVDGVDFTAVAPNTEDAVVVPEGYEQQVFLRWGDPVVEGAPAFDFDNQTAAAQALQFGFNNDFAGLLPIEGTPNAYLLVVNHEYTTEPFLFKGYDEENPTREQFEIGLAAHGLSVVQVNGESGSGKLTPAFGQYNRRITGTTEFLVTGPAAGSDLLKTSVDPTGTRVLGTFNNCSGGLTPWGTVLSGEENFNQYFGNAETVTDSAAAERLARYGIEGAGSDRKWERFDKRFDIAQEPNEVNRFGYVVEVDPWDPNSTPIKHTALGRFKHEAATIYVTDDGTVVAYSGDDERFDYMYKFVSSRKIMPGNGQAAMRENMRILDAGTLYVAVLTGDAPDRIDGSGTLPESGKFAGKGEWIPILRTNEDGRGESLVDGMSAEEVAVFTRQAGDKVGATKMDRPEDFEPNPVTGKVYVALTNNTNRGTEGKAAADEANPRNKNKNGQVLEIEDDHAGTSFVWNLLIVAGDPNEADTYFGGFDKSQVSPISCPDNLAFDSKGNLWISTDGNALESNDGLFAVVLDGERRGETRQFLTVPAGAETCGPIIQDERVVVAVQHPGEFDEASADNPISHWPDGGSSQPRPAMVAVWKA